MSDEQQDTGSPNEGGMTLREALMESYQENTGDKPTEDVVTDDIPTGEAPTLETSEAIEADAEPSEGDPQGDVEVIPAPEHWSDEDKAMFEASSADAQQYFLKRDKQYEQGIQSKSEELKPLQEAFGPYTELLKSRGVDQPTAIRAWVAAQSALDADPVAGIKMLIQSYGPDIQDKLNSHFGQEAVPDDFDVDPEVKQLRQQLRDQTRTQEQSQLQYRAARNAEAMTQVTQFKEAKDDKGELLHPHFDAAQSMMRVLVQSGQTPDLETAYKEAIWSVPAYREEQNKVVETKVAKTETDKRTAAAKKAKVIAKSVNGKGLKSPEVNVKATLHDDLKAAWEESKRGEING